MPGKSGGDVEVKKASAVEQKKGIRNVRKKKYRLFVEEENAWGTVQSRQGFCVVSAALSHPTASFSTNFKSGVSPGCRDVAPAARLRRAMGLWSWWRGANEFTTNNADSEETTSNLAPIDVKRELSEVIQFTVRSEIDLLDACSGGSSWFFLLPSRRQLGGVTMLARHSCCLPTKTVSNGRKRPFQGSNKEEKRKRGGCKIIEDGVPVVSCAGAGIFIFWQLGALKYITSHFDLSKARLHGGSAGAVLSTFIASGVDLNNAIRESYNIGMEAQVWTRNSHMGLFGPLIRKWLEKLLPEDAHERCNGRVRLLVTKVPSLNQKYVSHFTSREDLITACMASIHVPFFLNLKVRKNSPILGCDGKAFIVDYYEDAGIRPKKLDFLRLKTHQEVLYLVARGVRHARTLDATPHGRSLTRWNESDEDRTATQVTYDTIDKRVPSQQSEMRCALRRSRMVAPEAERMHQLEIRREAATATATMTVDCRM
eukprot:jgi/Bigna1/77699/fgenesh1_pg.49_\